MPGGRCVNRAGWQDAGLFFFFFCIWGFLKMEIVFESLHLFRLPSQRVDSRQRFNEYLDEIGTVCNIYVLDIL